MNLSETSTQPLSVPDSLVEPLIPITVVSTLRKAESQVPDSQSSGSHSYNAAIIDDLRTCLLILGALPGCISAELGRSMDSENDFVFLTRWESVGSYRRALSNFQVKAEVIPILSRYMVDSMTAEIMEVSGQNPTSFPSALAPDAATYERGNR